VEGQAAAGEFLGILVRALRAGNAGTVGAGGHGMAARVSMSSASASIRRPTIAEFATKIKIAYPCM
jgi:hypothetical protein